MTDDTEAKRRELIFRTSQTFDELSRELLDIINGGGSRKRARDRLMRCQLAFAEMQTLALLHDVQRPDRAGRLTRPVAN